MADAVRRKHIAQNRDIVRANTLAHLRIRELETRVLALEQERAEQVLRTGQQNAQVRRLEYALECVRVGWDTMAQGLAEAGVHAHTGAGDVRPLDEASRRVSLSEEAQAGRTYVARTVQPMEEIDEEEERTPLPLLAECPASVTRRRSRRYSHQVERSVPDELGEARYAPQEDRLEEVPERPAADTDASTAEASPAPVQSRPEMAHTPSPREPTPEAPSPQQESTAARLDPEPVPLPLTPTVRKQDTYPDDAPAPKRGRKSRLSLVPDLDVAELPDRARRTRKSVNYALPKLNTKMRKPDSHGARSKSRGRSTTPDSAQEESQAEVQAEVQAEAQAEAQAEQEHGQELGAQAEARADTQEARANAQEADARAGAQEAQAQAHTHTPTPAQAPRSAKTARRKTGTKSAEPVADPAPAESHPEPVPAESHSASGSDALFASTPLAEPTPAEPTPPSPAAPALQTPARAAPRRTRRSGAPEALFPPSAAPPRSATPHTKRQLPPSARLEMHGPPAVKPFAPRGQAAVLQQHSAQTMPGWASSLLNLASPDPPKTRVSLGKENSAPASPTPRKVRRGTLS